MSAIALAPSILSADFARLGEQVVEVEAAGADRIHIDVMDGHFVPNITIGPLVIRALRRVTRLPLEAHLMITEPDRYLEAFAEAGADGLTVHVEGGIHLHRTLESIVKLGRRVGLALNPATPAAVLDEVLSGLDLVLVMTVDPGLDFIASTVPKIRRIRELIDRVRPACELEVDGGIHAATAPLVVEAGARVLVAGSAVFEDPAGVRAGMQRLRRCACKSA
ncbi:MAG: ribulose-phosphate 3-epimerase [Gammaproteobacteria bacterium]